MSHLLCGAVRHDQPTGGPEQTPGRAKCGDWLAHVMVPELAHSAKAVLGQLFIPRKPRLEQPSRPFVALRHASLYFSARASLNAHSPYQTRAFRLAHCSQHENVQFTDPVSCLFYDRPYVSAHFDTLGAIWRTRSLGWHFGVLDIMAATGTLPRDQEIRQATIGRLVPVIVISHDCTMDNDGERCVSGLLRWRR